MRLPWLALLALAPALDARAAAPARARPDLVTVSRALLAVDAAARRGGEAAERKRWSEAAARSPLDAPARFLAVYARPPGEERWAAFRALARDLPRSALGQLGMALVYLEWDVPDQAAQAVDRALAIEPDAWLVVAVRARLHERQERDDRAAADWRAVLEADPRNPEAHLGLARLARRAGDAPAARASAERALAEDPAFAPALELLGSLALAGGREPEAAALWARVVEASPRDRAARATLAALLARRGDAAAARDQWQAAVELREDVEGLAALAAAARAAGDPGTERRALERLVALDPRSSGWGRLAALRLEAQDRDGAEQAFRRALEADPGDAAAWRGLGEVHLARGDALQAVDALRAAGDAGRAPLAELESRLHLQRLSRRDVNALQRAVSTLVGRTVRARAAGAPGLAGTLRLRVTVDAAGAATLVEVLEDSLHDGDVRASAYWNLHDATYPTGKPGRYAFTFSFSRPGA